jgi:plasmid stability protein
MTKEAIMATVTIRNLPDEIHRALRVLAASHGRSTEAEIRAILASAVCQPDRLRLGTALGELGRRAGLTDDDIAAIEQMRVKVSPEPMGFE